MSMKHLFLGALLLSLFGVELRAQTVRSSLEFLQFNPDSRSAGMGGAYLGGKSGMYLYADPTAFGRSQKSWSASYSLGLLPDRGSQSYHALALAYRLRPEWSILAGARMERGAQITLVDGNGMTTGSLRPYNWTIDLGTTWHFSPRWTGYLRGSLIKSYQGVNASSVALSTGLNYTSQASICHIPISYSITAGVNNLGWSLKYGDNQQEVNLPTSIDIGGSVEAHLASLHTIALGITAGCDLNQGVTNRLFGGVGVEYGFKEMLFVRSGLLHQNNLNMFTLGLGGQYKFAQLDMAYLMTKDSEFNQLRCTLTISL